MIAFRCAHCDRDLKVKDELTGKKVRCPSCGNAVAVPETTAARAAGQMQQGTPRSADEITLPPRAPKGADDRTLPPARQAAHDSLPDSDEQTDLGGKKGEATQTYATDAAHAELTDFLAPAEAADELGRLGGFRILKVLGHGGMGVVFQGEDPKLGRKVAIKAMLPHLAGSKSSQERFLREAKAAAALEHDHIVPILQIGEDRGAPFIVMPFLQGEPLDARLRREQTLPIAEVLRIGRETAEGLAAAHQCGLIHRDIKPANLWLESKDEGRRMKDETQQAAVSSFIPHPSSFFRVKILDFGLARAGGETGLTQTGAIIGTPQYMAPEQAAGRKNLDHRCDLFSLGCVLYRMCTGQMPFKGDDTLAIISSLAMDTPEPPVMLNLNIPTELSDLVMQLLAKKPEDRPQSAQAVVEAIRELESFIGEPKATGVTTRKLKPAGKTRTEAAATVLSPGAKRRVPKSWLAGGGVLVVAVGLLTFFLVSRERPEKAAGVSITSPDGNKGANGGPHPVTPFDGLTRAKNVSATELTVFTAGDAVKAPEELVAIFGDGCLIHTATINSFAFHPDGKTITTSVNVSPGLISDWDLATGRLLRSYLGGAKVFYSPDGQRLAFSIGEQIRLRAVVSDEQLPPIKAFDKTITCMALNKDGTGLAAAATGKDVHEVKILDFPSGKEHQSIKVNRQIARLAFSPDGTRLAGITWASPTPGQVYVWATATGTELKSWQGHTSLVKGLAFTADSKQLMTGCANSGGGIKFWDPDTGKELRTIHKERAVNDLALSPDGKLLALAHNGGLEVQETASGKRLWEKSNGDMSREGAGGRISGLAFDSSGQRLATRNDNVVDIWETASGKRLTPRQGPSGSLGQIAVSPNGKIIASFRGDNDIWLWDVTAGSSHSLKIAQVNNRSLAFRPDGAQLVVGARRFWDLEANKELPPLVGTNPGPIVSSYSPDGKRLLYIQPTYARPAVWDLATRKNLFELPEHRGKRDGTQAAVFSPDGRLIATAGGDKLVRLSDAETGKEVKVIEVSGDATIRNLAFSPDSRRLLIPVGQAAGVWDVAEGRMLFSLSAPEKASAEAVAYAPDGRTIAGIGTRSGSNPLVIWDAHSGKVQREIPLPTNFRPVQLLYAPDSRHLVAANPNGTIAIYRIGQAPAGKAPSPVAAAAPATYKNALGMEFVLVPKGKSWLGGGGGKPGDKEVEITQDFYLGKYEVTQEEWENVMGSNPSGFNQAAGIRPEIRKRLPVESMTWVDAQQFIKLVNEKTKEDGWLYRLPSEVEWEYACRGGPLSDRQQSAFDFYFDEPTNKLLPEQANFFRTQFRTSKVGSYPPNRLGLYDMHGNVWEWCADELKDEKGASKRVSRGGSGALGAEACRVTSRGANLGAQHRDAALGLRLARVPVGKENVKITVPEKSPNDPERRAATMLNPFATLTVALKDGKVVEVGRGQPLPTSPFKLAYVFIPFDNKPIPVDFVSKTLIPAVVDVSGCLGIGSPEPVLKTTEAELEQLVSSPSGKTLSSLILDLPVSAQTFELLGRLPALTSLGLRIDKADIKSLKLVATLRALTGLTLAGENNLQGTSEHSSALSGLSLKSFGLIGLKGIDSAFLQSLQEMRGLEELLLYRVNLRDERAIELTRLSQLRSLRLERNQLTDNSLDPLSKMHKLERLGLGGNRVTKDGVLKLAAALPRCKIQWDGGVVGPTLPSGFKNTLGMEFVLVPRGKSWLGGGGGKPGDKEVEIKEDFYLGKYEVTQAEWRKVMGSHPSLHSRTGALKDNLKTVDDLELDRFPVENVSWDDAQKFLEKLNLRDKVAGWVYRLPKEAEWEYACRGGPMSDPRDSEFDFYLEKPSHKLLPTQANFDFGEKALKRTCKVGLYAPNRLGLYDMHGNVTELCDDQIRGYGRAVRGGAWKTFPVPCSKNVVFEKTSRSDMIGLRVARVPVGKEIVKGMAP